jgi:hypothetical protein
MILRGVAIAVGLGLLAATAHIAIVQSGGYGSPHSFIVLAVAAGVGVGALTISVAWNEHRRGLAFAILVALLCGEAWGLIATGERIVISREQLQAPLRERADQHRAAAASLTLAQSAKILSADRSRLHLAQQRKQTSDDAARSAATDKNCRDNCRLLLQAAVDAALAEVNNARAEIAELENTQAIELSKRVQAATIALANAPMPTSPAPLADRLGLSGWALDLVTATLGSIAANGLAACLLAFGVHKRQTQAILGSPSPVVTALVPKLEPADPIAETPPRSKTEPMQPQPVLSAPTPKVRQPKPQVIERNHAARFAVEALKADPNGSIHFTELFATYKAWCASTGQQMLPEHTVGRELAMLFLSTGLTVKDGNLVGVVARS